MLSPANVPVMGVADFVAGFMFGMTGDNHLTEIEACYQGGEVMLPEIESGIADFKSGGWNNDVQGVMQFGLAILQVPASLKTCEAMGDDLKAIEQWASIFKDPKKLASTVSKHYLFHKADIQADIKSVETDWTTGTYFKSGEDLAALMTLAIGPITPALEGMALPPVDPFVPDFTAGLIKGFTGNDHKKELEGCMTDLTPIADDLLAVVADAKAGHFLKIASDLGNVIWMLPDAVSSCGELTELEADLKVMEDWAEVLKNPIEVTKIASKNWLFHGTHVKDDVKEQQDDYTKADYFGVGEMTADIALTLLPMQTRGFNLPPLEQVVPDFTAGLLMGFTGNDHRAELEGCMTNLEPLADDAKAALSDIKNFHLMKFAGDVGNFIWMLPEAVSTCQKVEDIEADLDVVLTWAKILKHPLKVSKIASKNWLFHGT